MRWSRADFGKWALRTPQTHFFHVVSRDLELQRQGHLAPRVEVLLRPKSLLSKVWDLSQNNFLFVKDPFNSRLRLVTSGGLLALTFGGESQRANLYFLFYVAWILAEVEWRSPRRSVQLDKTPEICFNCKEVDKRTTSSRWTIWSLNMIWSPEILN